MAFDYAVLHSGGMLRIREKAGTVTFILVNGDPSTELGFC